MLLASSSVFLSLATPTSGHTLGREVEQTMLSKVGCSFSLCEHTSSKLFGYSAL